MSQIIVKERPILMSGPNIKPLLEGRKTQTRRIIKPQPKVTEQRLRELGGWVQGMTLSEQVNAAWQSGFVDVKCPYGQPGDRLWVKETWFHQEGGPIYDAAGGVMDSFDDEIIYRADKPNRKGVKWKSSIFMPRCASRILLEITDVRVERLQDISEEDAKAEGAKSVDHVTGRECILEPWKGSYRLHYRDLWESINGARSWDANPFVWVIEFRRLP